MPPWSTFLVRHSTKSHHLAARWRISLAKAGSSSRFQTSRRSISTSPTVIQPDQFHRTRNIGIIAHIDAGKTTTTERMLYYSGHTKRIGDVDDGSTVTDFLPAERARGITIQSAAITFQWPPVDVKQPVSAGSSERPRSELPHQVNLIDTPGHADFTFEVRRSLRVLDGAICILDGVAGVEAQTEQVWNQAGEWKIPRLAYINKLDRDGAAFGRTVKEIAVKLGGWPALCQIPWFEGGKGLFCGVGDVINLGALHYEQGGDGKTVRHYSLDELAGREPMLADELRRARVALVELLSEHDDAIVDAFLEANEDHLSVSPHALWESLRGCLINKDSTVIPVFAGASFRNIGVQPLLDAVNNLLPSPSERLPPEITVGEAKANLEQFLTAGLAVATSRKASAQNVQTLAKSLKGCALAFKVVNDTRKGMLVYFRVYSGTIDRNDVLFNTNLKNSERATNLLRMYASESVPVQSVSAGQIGVIAGSKHARTGDTLISYSSNKATPPPPLDQLQLRPIQIPPPVFFASLEPNSLREEKDMHEKLSILLREDPSLQVSQDEDTGQTLISGMGELHLEIARDRLVGDLKANARMGNIAIGYRETFNRPSTNVSKIFDKDRSDAKGRAGCTSMVEPLIDSEDNLDVLDDTACVHVQDGNSIVVVAPTLDKKGRPATDDNVSLPSHLHLKEIQTAYINGALAALSRGPSYSYPVRGVLVKITLDPEQHIFGPETTYSALTAAARLATITAFRDAAASGGSALMEPVMNVDISVDDASLGSVIQDISSTRGGHIISLGDGEGDDADARQDAPKIDPSKVYAPLDPFEFGNSADNNHNINLPRSIKAKVPLREMVGYLKHLRSMTGGRGTFVMSVDQFVKMTGPREKALINELRGQV